MPVREACRYTTGPDGRGHGAVPPKAPIVGGVTVDRRWLRRSASPLAWRACQSVPESGWWGRSRVEPCGMSGRSGLPWADRQWGEIVREVLVRRVSVGPTGESPSASSPRVSGVVAQLPAAGPPLRDDGGRRRGRARWPGECVLTHVMRSGSAGHSLVRGWVGLMSATSRCGWTGRASGRRRSRGRCGPGSRPRRSPRRSRCSCPSTAR